MTTKLKQRDEDKNALNESIYLPLGRERLYDRRSKCLALSLEDYSGRVKAGNLPDPYLHDAAAMNRMAYAFWMPSSRRFEYA